MLQRVLELERQQGLEHLQLASERQAQVLEQQQGQDLELRQELVLVRSILQTLCNLSTLLCFNAVSIMMKEIASLPGNITTDAPAFCEHVLCVCVCCTMHISTNLIPL